MYVFLVHFFVGGNVILGFYLGEECFNLTKLKIKRNPVVTYVPVLSLQIAGMTFQQMSFCTLGRAEDTFTLEIFAPASCKTNFALGSYFKKAPLVRRQIKAPTWYRTAPDYSSMRSRSYLQTVPIA
jgi:hypothetical protein